MHTEATKHTRLHDDAYSDDGCEPVALHWWKFLSRCGFRVFICAELGVCERLCDPSYVLLTHSCPADPAEALCFFMLIKTLWGHKTYWISQFMSSYCCPHMQHLWGHVNCNYEYDQYTFGAFVNLCNSKSLPWQNLSHRSAECFFWPFTAFSVVTHSQINISSISPPWFNFEELSITFTDRVLISSAKATKGKVVV